MANVLKEYRCYTNGTLLCKASGIGQVEIMNPSNRVMNYTGPSRHSNDIGPKGDEFGRYAVDMRCKTCTRLLGRAVGTNLVCEIKCAHCKAMNLFDLEKMQWQRYYNLPEVRKTQLEKQILQAIGVEKL